MRPSLSYLNRRVHRDRAIGIASAAAVVAICTAAAYSNRHAMPRRSNNRAMEELVPSQDKLKESLERIYSAGPTFPKLFVFDLDVKT